MLPVEPADIREKYMSYVTLNGDELAGYVGATRPDKGKSEVGTLWVPEKYQEQGRAALLVGAITCQLVKMNIQPYAFCNDNSIRAFEKNEYVKSLPWAVPKSALAACGGCSAKPADGGCCDTIMIYNQGEQ